jgi:dipeptidyl aminopeptidase/acylaminoacyl peptidase
MRIRLVLASVLCSCLWFSPGGVSAQGTQADYQRSTTLNDRLRGLVVDVAEAPVWIENSHRFWYRKSVQGGNEFVLVDADAGQKRPAFDHQRLAPALSTASGTSYTAVTLPFSTFTFVDNERAIEFDANQSRFRCTLEPVQCTRLGEAAGGGRGGRGGGGGQGGGRGGGRGGQAQEEPFRVSPDSLWQAFIQNYNVALRPVGGRTVTMLSYDGSEGNAYTLNSIRWSPDSKKIAAYRRKPGYQRIVHYVRSSPQDQLQPRYETTSTLSGNPSTVYRKPGDVVDVDQPVIFNIETKQQFIVDNRLFSNAYALAQPRWWSDSRGFVFEYNQRGHQVYRVIEVDASTGVARALIEEAPKTFVEYSGKGFRRHIDDTREIIWMSERDGWNHLYVHDAASGQVKNQITKGEWVVRGVDSVDVRARQIWFRASGMNPRQDPYFIHYYRINFDGTGLTAFTEADGNHSVSWSPDRQFYVDSWSRVDLAPISQLKRATDQRVVLDLERGDYSELVKAGWRVPEVFVSKARDGKTDIWGIVIRPTNFDPRRKYPVIENIYAGPQGSFTPKTFSTQAGMLSLAELGFIVVQMDGLGTSNRSKAFHDVAWQNLGDAGFPDRILWHQAVAKKYAYYDITRVGIYGTSAGGQNSLGGLLFHPEFYDVAVSAVGCHDNRMDKIWWNEQWMGWPLGPHYEASSNMVNAHKLQGKVLLVVGELDTNVDPSSTLQVANALIQANKDFDLLFLPGAGHGAGGAYGTHKRNDFFVRHLLGVTPPDWNRNPTPVDGEDDANPANDWLTVPLDELLPPATGEWR